MLQTRGAAIRSWNQQYSILYYTVLYLEVAVHVGGEGLTRARQGIGALDVRDGLRVAFERVSILCGRL